MRDWQACCPIISFKCRLHCPDPASFRARGPGNLRDSVTHTVSLPLTAGYSTALRTVSRESMLLLAAPGRTKPQWIDDTLSALQDLTEPLELERGESGDNQGKLGNLRQQPLITVTSPSGESPGVLDSTSVDGLHTLEGEQTHGSTPIKVACNIAITVGRVIGEFSKQNHSGTQVSVPSGERIKRQKL